MKRIILIAAVLMVCGAAGQVLAAGYTAIELHPSGFTGSYAYGISGNQQVGGGWGSATGEWSHALLWNVSATDYVDLNPIGFTRSGAYGISGNQQVGYGGGSATGDWSHAFLWNGSATDFVDLNPSGFTESYAYGISGNRQIGYGWGSATENNWHALLWNGSATDYVDLNPSGFTRSHARGISGNQQVGYGRGSATRNNDHALLWNGSATDYVDLNPIGFTYSRSYATSGNQQVGYGGGHALLWNGSATDYVDLNPIGFIGSRAYGINGNQQVGYGWGSTTGNHEHALLWSGSATEYIDLHQFLPEGFVISYANGIDSYGNIAGGAIDSSGNEHAIVWIVPEPGTVGLLAFGGLIIRKAKMKSSKCIFVGLFLIFSLICSSMSYGDLILDQACDDPGLGAGYGVEQNLWLWQEFRPTKNNLEKVDLYLEAWGVPSDITVSFQIRDGGAILWSTSFSADLIVEEGTGWFEINTPQISLVSNHSYKLYLTSNLTYDQVWDGANIIWDVVGNNPYTRGKSVFDYYYGTNDDFMFHTWAVPEPGTVALFGLGGMIIRKAKGKR